MGSHVVQNHSFFKPNEDTIDVNSNNDGIYNENDLSVSGSDQYGIENEEHLDVANNNELSNNRVNCPKCEKNFLNKNSLNAHISRNHRKENTDLRSETKITLFTRFNDIIEKVDWDSDSWRCKE